MIAKNVSLVIVSHKSKSKIRDFVKSLSTNIKIIIIENSNDKSIKEEIDKIDKNIKIIFSENYGYGSAINLARQNINTNYFFIFNPDVKNIDDKMINEFYIAAKELKDDFGALGPRFLNVKDKSHKQSNINDKYGLINSISGSAMFFKTEIFDQIGGFDENIFLYFEETDYCYRSIKKGFKIYQINSSKIEHNAGTSTQTSTSDENKSLKKLLTWHFIWSKFYFYKKKYGKFISIIIFIPTLTRILFRILFNTLTNNREKKEKYKIRLSGLINSIKNNKSYKRIEDF